MNDQLNKRDIEFRIPSISHFLFIGITTRANANFPRFYQMRARISFRESVNY